MANKSRNGRSYAGKLSNRGVQEVKAVFPQGKPKGGKVKRGEDLRSGK